MSVIAVHESPSLDRKAQVLKDQIFKDKVFDVAVIGGGLHGLSAALHLARDGARVVVLERSWVGRHASGASAAGVRTLNRDIAELPLALEAMRMWRRMEQIVGDDCGFHAHGQIKVAENAAEMSSLEAYVAKRHAHGHGHEEIVDAQELHRLVPGIAPHCVGGAIVRDDGAADPHRTLRAFQKAATMAGVEIREGEGVTGIARKNGHFEIRCCSGVFEAGQVVNAAGAWAAEIAALMGEDIHLSTKASMMIVTERVCDFVSPVISAVGRQLSFKQTDRGTLLIGGGIQGGFDLKSERASADFVSLSQAARAAIELFPDTRDVRIVRAWAGLEAKTDDNLPVIGASPNIPGLFHVFGFSGHGFQLVPVAGAVIADLVMRGGTNRAISAFHARRLMKGSAAA